MSSGAPTGTIERGALSGGASRNGSSLGLRSFLSSSADDLKDAIVRGEAARRERRRLVSLGIEPPATPDLATLGSLVRVMERQGLGTVRELGEPAAYLWARRIGITSA